MLVARSASERELRGAVLQLLSQELAQLAEALAGRVRPAGVGQDLLDAGERSAAWSDGAYGRGRVGPSVAGPRLVGP